MSRQTRYPQEVRERAVRMVFEHTCDYESEWAAIKSISSKFGMTVETLRLWARRAETDAGMRPGLTSDERARMKELERENRELRHANEILKTTLTLFPRGRLLHCRVRDSAVNPCWPVDRLASGSGN